VILNDHQDGEKAKIFRESYLYADQRGRKILRNPDKTSANKLSFRGERFAGFLADGAPIKEPQEISILLREIRGKSHIPPFFAPPPRASPRMGRRSRKSQGWRMCFGTNADFSCDRGLLQRHRRVCSLKKIVVMYPRS
jgi:hypothetical protein